MRLERIELAGGVELHFIEKGDGPALLLMHGGLGDCHAWDAQMAALATHFRVVAYSRRHSSPNRNPATPHSLDADVDDLDGLLCCLLINRAYLVGTSYGSLVALAFALKQPERVAALVLAEPPLHPWACRTPAGADLYAAFMHDVWQPAGAAFAHGRECQAVQILVDGMWGCSVFESFDPRRRQVALRNAGAMRLHAQASDPFPCFPRAAVAQLRTPSLLLHGEQTSSLHRIVVEELGAALPCATRVAIPDAGHGSPSEQPEAFNAAVLRFLTEDRNSRG